MEQNKRTRVLKGFDNSKVNVLVCTDVAGRGLDISGVSHVYNYDLPLDAKDYIHRIGRTARAGAEGIVINILASRDYNNFMNIQKHNQSLVVERLMTPEFKKIFVKFDSPRRPRGRFGNGDRPQRTNFHGKNMKGKRSNGNSRRNRR
ncbi:ATP-dependent helicase, partial [Candidatus Pacearchaeota archaeon]|nr:ATP-dependent helicase [Candidatus Pacearchaeota archaeon]